MDLYSTQILLEKSQHEALLRIARQENRSLSEVVREMLARELHTLERRQMLLAARELQVEYQTDEELAAFTALNGEDFLFKDDERAQG